MTKKLMSEKKLQHLQLFDNGFSMKNVLKKLICDMFGTRTHPKPNSVRTFAMANDRRSVTKLTIVVLSLPAKNSPIFSFVNKYRIVGGCQLARAEWKTVH